MVSEKTGGAETFSYGLTQTSVLQLSRSVPSSRWRTCQKRVLLELAQLASRVASAILFAMACVSGTLRSSTGRAGKDHRLGA